MVAGLSGAHARADASRGRIAYLKAAGAATEGLLLSLARARLACHAFSAAPEHPSDIVLIDARAPGALDRAARLAEALKPLRATRILLVAALASDAAARPDLAARTRRAADLVLAGPDAHRPVAARCQALIRLQMTAAELGARLDDAGAGAGSADLAPGRAPRVLIAGAAAPEVLALMNALKARGAEAAAVFTPPQTARALSSFDPDCLVIRPVREDDPFAAVAALMRTDARHAIRPLIAYADPSLIDAGGVSFEYDHAAPDIDAERAAATVLAGARRAFAADAFSKGLKSAEARQLDPDGSGVLSAESFAMRWRRLGRGSVGAGLGLIHAPDLARLNDRGARALAVHGAADIISRALRGYDAAGRLGDDVFAVAFPSTGLADAARATERVAALLRSSPAPVGAPASLYARIRSAWTVREEYEQPERALLRAARQLAEG